MKLTSALQKKKKRLIHDLKLGLIAFSLRARLVWIVLLKIHIYQDYLCLILPFLGYKTSLSVTKKVNLEEICNSMIILPSVPF